MRRLLTVSALIVCLGSTMSCSTISKTKEKLDYLNAKIDKVVEESEEKLLEWEKKGKATEAKLASVGIALDADGDGVVSFSEAKEASTALARGSISNPRKRELLMDPTYWSGLVGAVASVVLMSRRRRTKAKIQELEGKVTGGSA